MQEERLRAVLPFLRPRTEEPTGLVLLLFIVLCLGIAGLFVLHIWRQRAQRLQVEARFAKLGAEKGLAPAQSAYLVRLAWQHRMNNPLLLLNSVYAFDRVVGHRAAGLTEIADETELRRIGALRAALGFDRLPPNQPLRTTRQLAPGLTVMIWQEGAERFFPWILVERDERGLTVVPLFKEDYAPFARLAPGDLLTARIWREEDTEYRFCCEVLALVDGDGLIASLRHDEAVERLQQRDFYRLDIQFDIDFIVVGLTAEEEREEQEQEGTTTDDGLLGRRLAGQVLNLSAGGLSALIDPPVAGGCQLRVDSACNRPFALGGLSCEVLGEPDPGAHVQLRFADLPPDRERELVRQIYQYQTGRDCPAAD